MILKLPPALICLAATACSSEHNDPPYFREPLACIAPAEPDSSPWSKTGGQRACKINHGPFVAWDNGYVHIRGQYDMGKQTGLWCYYNEQGQVADLTDFSASGEGKAALTSRCVVAAQGGR